MKNIFKEKKLKLYILFLAYLIVSFILMVKHEIWADEAQAWEIAKNLSIPEIFMQMKYETHPCLWHLILTIPAKLGLPVISMNIISFLITSIAVYIILFRSNLNILIKILIIFNPVFIYYLSAISRNYCLVLLFISFWAILYDKREEKTISYIIIIALLAQTHLIISGFVGISAIIFLLELLKKKKYKLASISFLILSLSFIILILQIFPISNSIMISDKITINKLLDMASEVAVFFINGLDKYQSLIVLLAVLFLSTIITFLNSKKKGIILLISVLSIYIIHLFWPFALPERVSIIFVIIIFLNLDNNHIHYNLFIAILSIVISYSNFGRIHFDFSKDYSDSKHFATFINKNIEDNSLIAIIDTESHMSVIPYIKKEKNFTYYLIDVDKYITYSPWILKDNRIRTCNEIEKKLRKFSNKYENIYIMYGVSWYNNFTKNRIKELEDRNDIEQMVYQTNNDSVERFGLYKYRKN